MPGSGISKAVAEPMRPAPAADPLVEALVGGEDLVGLRAGAEEDRLERLRGVGQPLERTLPRPRVLPGADERARIERADHQRPLTVEQADRPLGVDAPQQR